MYKYSLKYWYLMLNATPLATSSLLVHIGQPSQCSLCCDPWFGVCIRGRSVGLAEDLQSKTWANYWWVYRWFLPVVNGYWLLLMAIYWRLLIVIDRCWLTVVINGCLMAIDGRRWLSLSNLLWMVIDGYIRSDSWWCSQVAALRIHAAHPCCGCGEICWKRCSKHNSQIPDVEVTPPIQSMSTWVWH